MATILVLAAGLGGLAVHELLFRVAGRVAGGIEASLVRHARAPTRLLLPLAAVLVFLPAAGLSADAETIARRALSLGLIAAFGWLVIALLRVGDDMIAERYPIDQRDNLEARAVNTRMRILRRAAVMIVVVVTASIMLISLPGARQLGISLLASAGLATLVVGMAARPALENLIAGLQIALTQPIRLDDVVVVEGEWGKIEEITLTYVVVRIWDARRLVVPLSYFVHRPQEVWTRTTSDLLATVQLYADYTVPVDAVRAELRRILDGCPEWDGRVWNLQVTAATDHAVELRALMSAPDSGAAWDLRCRVREQLIGFLQREHPASLPRLRAEVERPNA